MASSGNRYAEQSSALEEGRLFALLVEEERLEGTFYENDAIELLSVRLVNVHHQYAFGVLFSGDQALLIENLLHQKG